MEVYFALLETNVLILSYLHRFKMVAHVYHVVAHLDLVRLCTATC